MIKRINVSFNKNDLILLKKCQLNKYTDIKLTPLVKFLALQKARELNNSVIKLNKNRKGE